jgi:hypothetical protein
VARAGETATAVATVRPPYPAALINEFQSKRNPLP